MTDCMASQTQIIAEIRRDAETHAGPLHSLRIRARGYLTLYHASDQTCHFALVASHGALWASWYLIFAKLGALVLACIDPTCAMTPRQRYRQLAAYVLLLKDINRLVMVETYVLIHCIKRLGPEGAIAAGIPTDLAHDYARAMTMQDTSPELLRDIYHRHFLWEQDRVVSSRLDDGFAVFTWPLMRNLCQRPWVWFSYFSIGKSMNFKNFTDKAERVEKGLIAYDRARAVGFDRVARVTNVRLRILPGTVFWRHSLRKLAGPLGRG